MPRLPLPDILQRGITYSLAGLTVYGLFVGVAVHRDTLRRGRELMAEREAAARQVNQNEEMEKELAKAAQSALYPSSTTSGTH
ncbi:hypothetical protein BDN71DRAFT_1449304 [Pleurotus eryngii]|uniref:Uncharacterized protein n=1 Tax=Pleurotus eryngii TaxID=5323 RepID=A0A9P5ZW13_PLEER|nr:hypothetical protein BDN71DRAFT_1449304 [Pleurotus eryngii]